MKPIREPKPDPERYEFEEPPRYAFDLTRRAFVQSIGAGLMITAYAPDVWAQGRGGAAVQVSARFHFELDGSVTAYTGKVEVGQGARAELTQAAAEELRLPIERVRLVMADTDEVPDDGGTYGSQSTPRTVPAIRAAGATARDALIELAAAEWDAAPGAIDFYDGEFRHTDGRRMTLGALVSKQSDLPGALNRKPANSSETTSPDQWRVLGKDIRRPNARDIVTGAHQYPSDIRRRGMLYGRILRAPSYGAELKSVNEHAADEMKDVTAVRDGAFVGCVARTSRDAQRALEKIAATAQWTLKLHPATRDLADYLRAQSGSGPVSGRSAPRQEGDVDAALAGAGSAALRASYFVPYIAHAPMETRAAVAEWDAGRLTVWTATQRPFDVKRELSEAFSVPMNNVRLIVPDSGGGFGGKHQGDAAVEAARLAKAVDRPVSLQWTREEEFTWAYFRPAGVIDVAAALDQNGRPLAWDFVNINSGGSGIDCPYAFPNTRVQFKNSQSPMRQGSYRALAAVANNFARETMIDRLAVKAGQDPLAFRLASLKDERLKGVVRAAAEKFGATDFRKSASEAAGIGIACGTEKGSFVAACAEVAVNRDAKTFEVLRLCVAFDCGPVLNPAGLRIQIEGGIIMGLGGALREVIEFSDGKVLNARFKDYLVPRFEDVPPLDIVFVETKDVPSAGAGETPIIAVAPAIANAIRMVTGTDLTALPLRIS